MSRLDAPTFVAAVVLSLAVAACRSQPATAEPPPARPAKAPPEAPAPEPEGIKCVPALTASGALPHRTAERVQAEQGPFEFHAAQLTGHNLMQGGPPPAFTTRQLHEALRSGNWAPTRAAAFLMGRCKAADGAADARLTAALEAALRTLTGPSERAEAAMSLALRGKPEAARPALLEAAKAAATHEPWVAAGYLAQLGDPAAWPYLLRALEDPQLAPTRIHALRTVPAFVPLAGKTAPSPAGADAPPVAVDPAAAAAGRAKDTDPTVRAVVPGVLVAIVHPRAREVIGSLASADPDEWVRQQAKAALAALDASAAPK